MTLALPEYAAAANLLAEGASPLWNPFHSCGAPLFAAPDLGLAYPLSLLLIFLPAKAGLLAFMSVHVALCLVATRALAAGAETRARKAWGLWLAFGAAFSASWDFPMLLPAWTWLAWGLVSEKAGPGKAGAAICLLLAAAASPLLGLAGLAGALGRAKARGVWAGMVAPGLVCAAALVIWIPVAERVLCSGWRRHVPVLGNGDDSPGSGLHTSLRETRLGDWPGLGGGSRAGLRADALNGLHLSWGASSATQQQVRVEKLMQAQNPESSNLTSLSGIGGFLREGKLERWRSPIRAALVGSARQRGLDAGDLALMTQPVFSRPLILEEAAEGAEGPAFGAAWTLLPYGRKGNEVRVSLPQGHAGGWLYVSDSWYPGWKAWLDGRREKVLRAERAFRAVRVRPGDRELRMRYQPLSFALGLGISLAALAFLVAWSWRHAGLAH